MIRRLPTAKAALGARHRCTFDQAAAKPSLQISSGQQTDAPAGVISIILLFASQTVLITALLYYFGWVRTRANFDYFGVDVSLLGFTTVDYVLRSINSAFPPLIGLALVALALLSFHRRAVCSMATSSMNTPLVRILTGFIFIGPFLGTVFALAVFVGIVFPGQIGRPLGLALPVMLVLAVGTLGYSANFRLLRLAALSRKKHNHPLDLRPRAQVAVMAAIGVLGVLWWVALYANQVGERAAEESVATLPSEPEIIIYSSDRIAVAGPGVVVDEIQQAGSKYRYRYSGLRLLVQAGDRYILIPVRWQKGEKVYLVPRDDTIRVDMIGQRTSKLNSVGVIVHAATN